MSKKKNHEADIKNPNKKTPGQNTAYAKSQKNRDKQLKKEQLKLAIQIQKKEEELSRLKLKEKEKRDDWSDRLNPNNRKCPEYKKPQ